MVLHDNLRAAVHFCAHCFCFREDSFCQLLWITFLIRDLKLCIFSWNVFAEEFVLSSLGTSPLIKPFQTPGGVEMRILEFLRRFKMGVHVENIFYLKCFTLIDACIE